MKIGEAHRGIWLLTFLKYCKHPWKLITKWWDYLAQFKPQRKEIKMNTFFFLPSSQGQSLQLTWCAVAQHSDLNEGPFLAIITRGSSQLVGTILVSSALYQHQAAENLASILQIWTQKSSPTNIPKLIISMGKTTGGYFSSSFCSTSLRLCANTTHIK